ncbi:GtrA family protein, partial [Clostridium neonatale]
MNQLIKRIKDIFLSREFILFLIVGVINTFNGTIFASIYSIFLNENIVFVLGDISSLIISYILNSFITF